MNIHHRAEAAVIPRRWVLDVRTDGKTEPLVRDDDVLQPPMGLALRGQLCEVRVVVRITEGRMTTPCRAFIYDWVGRIWVAMRGDLIGGPHLSVWRAGIDAANVGPDGLTRIRLDARQASGEPHIHAWVNFNLVPPEAVPDGDPTEPQAPAQDSI